MSLMSLSQKHNQEQDAAFLAETAELAASETAPTAPGTTGFAGRDDVGPDPDPDDLDLPARHEGMMSRVRTAQSAPVGAAVAAAPEDETPPSTPARVEAAEGPVPAPLVRPDPEDAGVPEASDQPPPPAPVDPPRSADPAPPVAPPPAPSRALADFADPVDPVADPGPAEPPPGISGTSGALVLTDEDRVVALAGERVRGSVVDAGLSAEELLAGKHPRPSVASQREIRDFNRRRVGDLLIRRPPNWPEFMTFPTEMQLRALRRDGVTPEHVRDFEAVMQERADAMEARAREINDWILSVGDPRLNRLHERSIERNRAEAIRRRSAPITQNKKEANQPEIGEVTDAELYKDPHYGIRFALLLNTDENHLKTLQGVPVSTWGHDRLRTMDGGRVRAGKDEIVVTTVSLQAAQLMVLEAKARGWETLRVSGDNEFCEAVKRACKESGMGAIIRSRGPLGLGPFGRTEVVMPSLPPVMSPLLKDPNAPERNRKAADAPEGDQEAARTLLGEGAPAPRKGPVDLGRVRALEARPDPDRDGPRDETPGMG